MEDKNNIDKPRIIPLQTYEGSGETLHPSVIDIGFPWNGYRYWMTNTPMPRGDSRFENPSIWVSNDGLNWIIPDGLDNPVVKFPGDGSNADGDLYFENGILYLIYKETVTAGIRIKMTRSNDGINWDKPKIILSPANDEYENISPTLIKINDVYYIYYFTYGSKNNVRDNPRIRRMKCYVIDGLYGNPEDINVPWLEESVWWHLHLYKFAGEYFMSALKSYSNNPGNEIYMMRSFDGINFRLSSVSLLDAGNMPDNAEAVYRPCITTIENNTYLFCGIRIMDKWQLLRMNINLS